jgi:hypothetical protein
MTLDVSIRVGLKGVDPVISTAFLTLTEKMGYQGRLLGLNRLESYEFSAECRDQDSTLEPLRRMLATRTTFYNRNKNNYFVEYRWNGRKQVEGLALATLESLAGQVKRWAALGRAGDLDSQGSASRVILHRAPVFRSEVLVEDIDTVAKTALAAQLASELGATAVKVSELGVRWYLALRVGSEDDARRVTREIAVAEARDRGILLNPNHQRYTLLSLDPMELNTA